MEKYPGFSNKSDNEKVDKKERKSKKNEDDNEKSKTGSFLDAIKSLFTRDQSQEEIDRMLKEAERVRRLQEQGEDRQSQAERGSVKAEAETTAAQTYHSDSEQRQSNQESLYDNKLINFLGKKILKYIGLDSTPNQTGNEDKLSSRNHANKAESPQSSESFNQTEPLESSSPERIESFPSDLQSFETGRTKLNYEQEHPQNRELTSSYEETGYPIGEPSLVSRQETKSPKREEVRSVEPGPRPVSSITEWFNKNKQRRENRALKKAIKNTQEKLSDQSTELKEQERLIKRLETLKQFEGKTVERMPGVAPGNLNERISAGKANSLEKDHQASRANIDKRPKHEVSKPKKFEKITLNDNKSVEVDRSRMQTDKNIEKLRSEDKNEYTPEFSQYYRNQDLAGRSEAELMKEKEELLKKNNLILDNKIIDKIKKKDQLNQAIKPKNIRKDPTLSAFYTLIIVFTIVILLIIFT